MTRRQRRGQTRTISQRCIQKVWVAGHSHRQQSFLALGFQVSELASIRVMRAAFLRLTLLPMPDISRESIQFRGCAWGIFLKNFAAKALFLCIYARARSLNCAHPRLHQTS